VNPAIPKGYCERNLKNKANLPKGKFGTSSFITSKYEKLGDSGAVKNKANFNCRRQNVGGVVIQ